MRLNGSMVSLCSYLTPSYCQSNRKLILVCDMDETLISELDNGNRVVVRPKINYILRILRNIYEPCLVTYSTRERTESILRQHLDPESKIFGNRVLCREDIIPHFRNKLDAFLAHMPVSFGKTPCATREVVGNVHARHTTHSRSINRGFTTIRTRRPPVWTYMVVLDDFPMAWSNLLTCIPIRPYLPNNGARGRSNKSEGTYVLSLHRFLNKLHHAVFRESRLTAHRVDSTTNRANAEQIRGRSISAYSVLSRIRRRPSQAHRFQTLCHDDPGRLIDFDSRRMIHRPLIRGSDTSSETPARFPRFSPTKNEHFATLPVHQHVYNFRTPSRFSSTLNEKFLNYDVADPGYSHSNLNPSEQLIRHVYRRAKLTPEVETTMYRM